MRAWGYCRVSSAGQAAEGVSLDAQRARIAAWCAARGAELINIHVDAGISGFRKENRPGLKAALAAVCAGGRGRGEGRVLVVYSLSRMARSSKDSFIISEMIDKAGADLVSLTENVDTTTAAGRMFFGVLAVMNQFERDLASERTKLAAAFKRSKGEAWATPPFGQAKDAAGRLVDAPAERRVVDEVIKLRSDGMSIRAIVAALNARGVPTRHDGKWHIATVQRVLRRARAGA
jgi:site-specific DNA recombinase